jgi:hypothetical protein
MAETPRASFRLQPHTLRQIDLILAKYREHNPYDRTTKTAVIERAVDELHRQTCPPEPTPTIKPRAQRSRP